MQDKEFNALRSDLPAGLSVIEASAGTGKTYAISHLVPRLLLDGSLDRLSELLLVTYTKDAAGELAERVRKVLTQLANPALPDEKEKAPGVAELRAAFLENAKPGVRERLTRALLEIDQLGVSTIHSFCQRVLQAEGTLCGLPTLPELIPDTRELLEEAVFDLWCEHISQDPHLSALAAAQGWSLQDDQRFVASCASLDDVCFLPAAEQRFQELREHLREALLTLRSAQNEAFYSLVISLGEDSWLKGRHEEAGRAVERLRSQAAVTLDVESLSALQFLGEVQKSLGKRSKAQKALVEQTQAMPGYERLAELQSLIQSVRWSWQQFCSEKATRRVAGLLRDKRQITYDGLITTLQKALQAEGTGPLLAERLRERHRIGIIDESQDTDPRQFDIFTRIFLKPGSEHRLILIGDPKQAIYGFRGADLNTYLEARQSALREEQGEQRLFSLTKTYRAPEPLVSAVNAIFARQDALLNRELDFTPASSGLGDKGTRLFLKGQEVCARLEAWLVPDEDQESYSTTAKRVEQITRRCAGAILELLQHGGLQEEGQSSTSPVLPSDIAVLTNSNGEAEEMALALRQLGIPVVVSSTGDVLATDEAAEIELLLRALDNPRKSGLRYAALATRLLGFSAAEIQSLRATPNEDELWLDLFQSWRNTWENKGVAALFAEIEKHRPLTLNLARGETGERRSANFRQLTSLLQELSLTQAPRPAHQLRWLRQEITRAEGKSNIEERQLQLESDARAVQVVTMHKSKGLEYKLVFCPFLWASSRAALGGNQILRRGGGIGRDTLFNLDLGKDLHPQQFEDYLRRYLEDRIRLCYVALTRAKVKAWFVCGAIGNKNSKANPPVSPLDWLLRPDETEPDLAQAGRFLSWTEEAALPFVAGKHEGRGARHGRGLERIQAGATSASLLGILPPPLPAAAGAYYKPDQQETTTLAALECQPPARGWRITSFSGLTREKHAHDGTPAHAQKPVAGTDSDRPYADAAPNRFLAAPAGAAVGTLVHDYIEGWDFSPPHLDALRRHVEEARFKTRTPTQVSFEEQLLSLLEHLRESRLPGLDCSLAEACPQAHGSEWHFHLPISRTGLNGALLAEAFAQHAAPEHRFYAQALRDLSPAELGGLLQGFLQGFIDRLLHKDGHWGVIDWKTNRLGESPDDYAPEALLQCAMDAHYFLQTHLYLVALRRFLRQRRRPFVLAGAWLVFLRAVEAGTEKGMLHIQPPPALLDALETLFMARHSPA